MTPPSTAATASRHGMRDSRRFSSSSGLSRPSPAAAGPWRGRGSGTRSRIRGRSRSRRSVPSFRAIAGLLLELAMGGDQRVLDRAVVSFERAGRQLEHRSAARDAVLSDQEKAALAVERGHDDGAGVDDDVADGLGSVAANKPVLPRNPCSGRGCNGRRSTTRSSSATSASRRSSRTESRSGWPVGTRFGRRLAGESGMSELYGRRAAAGAFRQGLGPRSCLPR